MCWHTYSRATLKKHVSCKIIWIPVFPRKLNDHASNKFQQPINQTPKTSGISFKEISPNMNYKASIFYPRSLCDSNRNTQHNLFVFAKRFTGSLSECAEDLRQRKASCRMVWASTSGSKKLNHAMPTKTPCIRMFITTKTWVWDKNGWATRILWICGSWKSTKYPLHKIYWKYLKAKGAICYGYMLHSASRQALSHNFPPFNNRWNKPAGTDCTSWFPNPPGDSGN